MKKEILIISGSPRKGIGYHTINELKRSLLNHDDYEFDYIRVSNLSLHHCIGCMKCFREGESHCPFYSDLENLLHQLQQCSGLIVHSPVYALGITGTLKLAIDRLSYMFHRPQLIAKPVLTLVTTDGGGINPTKKYLNSVWRGFGCHLIGTLSIIGPFFDDSHQYHRVKYKDKITQQLLDLSLQFHEHILLKKQPNPTYGDLMMFQGLKSKTYLFEADYDYWNKQGWLQSNYFYKTSLNPMKRYFNKILESLIKLLVRKYKNSNSQA